LVPGNTGPLYCKKCLELTLREEVVLDVPEAVGVSLGRVARDLLLLEAPLGQLLPAGGEDAPHEVVVQLDLRRHGLDGGTVASADNFNAPNVVGIADAALKFIFMAENKLEVRVHRIKDGSKIFK